MTYEVDFEKSTDIGDARYYLVRVGRVTRVMRQWLNGDRPDPTCQKEVVEKDEIPEPLVGPYNVLYSGGIPSIT